MATSTDGAAVREQRHREAITRLFEVTHHTGWPEGFDPLEQGLVIIYTTPYQGRLHRASCPVVKRNVNGYRSETPQVVLNAHSRAGGDEPSLVCNVCESAQVVEGAAYWGETAEQVRERHERAAEARRAGDQARALDNARSSAHSTFTSAQYRALQALRERHVEEYQGLLAGLLTEITAPPLLG